MERFGFKRKFHIRIGRKCAGILLASIIILIGILVNYMDNLIEGTLHVLCDAKVESIGITLSNKAISEVMHSLTYEDLITFMKDDSGRIIALKSNIVKMNQISSDIAVKVQEMYDELDDIYVYVPLRKFYRK